jgi:hypothetical protein
MKHLFFILLISTFCACKAKQKSIVSTPATEQTSPKPKTIGKVSHKYKATGCATVIIVEGASDPLILIPKDKLPSDIDVDGLEISFNYHTLRIPQPKGCNEGIPALIKDITKK